MIKSESPCWSRWPNGDHQIKNKDRNWPLCHCRPNARCTSLFAEDQSQHPLETNYHILKSGISSLNHIPTNYHDIIGRGQLKGSPNHKEIVFFGHCPNMIFRMGLPYRPPAENCASWFPFLRLSTPSNRSQVTTMKKVGIGTMPKQQKIRNINRRHLQTQWWALVVPHLRDSSTQPLIQHSLHRAIRT